MGDDDVWGTGLSAWKWAELFGLIALIGAVRLEPQWVADQTHRTVVGLIGLGLFIHITTWMVPELRRRL